MKLLLFSDIHRSVRAAENMVALSKQVDIVVCAGDLATGRRGLPEMIDVLRDITCPTVLVSGNSESPQELREACANWTSAHVLHGDGVTVRGIDFFGLGGAVPVTPFSDWSYDLTEEQATRLLVECPKGGVLVSHSPPYGAVDVCSSGKSLGSESVRKTMSRCKPRLVVCGHIHASAGEQTTLGETCVINAGPLGVICELSV